MELLSQAAYARRVGVSRAAITLWKRRGDVVLEGSLVNVEATDERLKAYRRDGLNVDPHPKAVKRGRPRVKQTANVFALLNGFSGAEPESLPCCEVQAQLAALDWTQTFDWSEEAQDQRARLAARCVGLEAVKSDLRDTGHWGGHQLRYPEYGDLTGPDAEDGVAGGFGFELNCADVLARCRAALESIDENDTVTVRLNLLPVLARPFAEYDLPGD